MQVHIYSIWVLVRSKTNHKRYRKAAYLTGEYIQLLEHRVSISRLNQDVNKPGLDAHSGV